jgi:hypothetical protein
MSGQPCSEAVARHDAVYCDAESLLGALEDASLALDAKIADAQQRLCQELDRIPRATEAKTCSELAAAIESAIEQYDAAAKKLAAALFTAVSFQAAHLAGVVAVVRRGG